MESNLNPMTKFLGLGEKHPYSKPPLKGTLFEITALPETVGLGLAETNK
jgi:hypothetical protein